MTKKIPQVELSWRDECYGSVHAVAAFRNYAPSADWSQRTRRRFAAAVKRAGFSFHEGRCSYIAESGVEAELQRALCEELAAAGFEIAAGDRRTGRSRRE